MASLQPIKKKPLPFRLPTEGVAGWKKLTPLFRFILNQMGFRLSMENIDGQETADGVHLKGLGSAAAADLVAPFNVTVSGTTYTVESGTFAGVIPSALTGSIAATGTQYVYLKATYTFSTSAGGYVYGYSFSSAAIEIKSAIQSLPLGPNTTGIFYILLATVVDGVKTAQQVVTSLTAEIVANGTDSKGNLVTFAS